MECDLAIIRLLQIAFDTILKYAFRIKEDFENVPENDTETP